MEMGIICVMCSGLGCDCCKLRSGGMLTEGQLCKVGVSRAFKYCAGGRLPRTRKQKPYAGRSVGQQRGDASVCCPYSPAGSHRTEEGSLILQGDSLDMQGFLSGWYRI